MDKLYLICVDDQREVLNALAEDLNWIGDYLNLEICESAKEVLEIMEEIDQKGDHLALIISDHVMPDVTGVDLLKNIYMDGRFIHTQKILLTGLATHQDTIEAINQAQLDHYIEKPWDSTELRHVVKKYLTNFILKSGLDHMPYLACLDQEILREALHSRGT
jgi:two-component system chemotaxis response regulator CheY